MRLDFTPENRFQPGWSVFQTPFGEPTTIFEWAEWFDINAFGDWMISPTDATAGTSLGRAPAILMLKDPKDVMTFRLRYPDVEPLAEDNPWVNDRFFAVTGAELERRKIKIDHQRDKFLLEFAPDTKVRKEALARIKKRLVERAMAKRRR